MESWDDDDYNPDEQITSRIADAVATFGLDEKVKQPPEPEAPKPATKKPSATSLAAKANASSNSARGDLSRAEILELQQRGEVCMEMAEDKNAATPSSDQTESAKEQEAKDVLKELEVAPPPKQVNKPKGQQKKKPRSQLLDDCLDDEFDGYTMDEKLY